MTDSSPAEKLVGRGEQEGGGGEGWLWRANEETEFHNAADQFGTRIGLSVVTLNSAKPLYYDQVKQSFQIVQRKCRNLRIALQTRGNELWFRELIDADVDFKVLEEDTDVIEAMEKSCKEGFHSTDKAHWRVRLIPRSLDTSCALQDVKVDFPYQYDYFIHSNHILLDGINLAIFIQMSHTILDNVINGKSYPDIEEYGDYTEKNGLEELEEKIEKMFHENPKYLAKLVSEMPSPTKTLWLTKVYPRPEVEKPATKHISRMINSETLSKFKDKAKTAGITFNSAFVAMINAAFVDLMVEGDVLEKNYRLYVNHLINIRRYLGKTDTIPLGAYQYPLSHFSDVSVSVKENFWEYAGNYHRDLLSKLKSGTVLEQKVLKKLKRFSMSPMEFFQNPPPVVHDFSVSNVGDMTSFIPGIGKHVQVTDLQPYNVLHSLIHMQLHQIVTYRGHSRYTLSYDTSYMNDITANKVVDKVFYVLEELSNIDSNLYRLHI